MMRLFRKSAVYSRTNVPCLPVFIQAHKKPRPEKRSILENAYSSEWHETALCVRFVSCTFKQSRKVYCLHQLLPCTHVCRHV